MKRAFAILLILAMALSLAACGDSGAPDPNCGVYECSTVEAFGMTMESSGVFGDDFSIELKAGGKAVLRYEGKTQSMRWTLDGGAIHIEGGGQSMDGTLSDGTMVLENMLGTGMTATFVNRDYTAAPTTQSGVPAIKSTPEPTPEPTEEPMTPEKWWNGTWYGWAVIYKAGGAYENDANTAWDVCADIEVQGEAGNIVIYAAGQTAANPTGQASLMWIPSVSAHGRLLSKEGSFLFDEVEEAEWILDPDNAMFSKWDPFVSIYGQCYADEDGNWFTYYVFLRPWGVLWDDVQDADTTGMPYPSMMPMHYEDWYLEQLGEEALNPEKPAAQPTAEPEPTAETHTLAPGEPSSTGSGVIGMEKLLRLYKWLDTMDGSLLFSKTYPELVAVAGTDGADCGNSGPNSVSDLGDHYFNWYADEYHYIHVGFRADKDGAWTVCGLNTSNITRADYASTDISDLAPRAGGATQDVEFTFSDFYDHHSCTVQAQLPAQNWFGQLKSHTVYFYNAVSEDKIHSGSARIQLEMKDTPEGFDFYIDSFTNLKELPARTIGGIEMVGRSYTYVGMNWIEYIGTAPGGFAISVKISDVELSDGSEGSAILDSIRFSW